jgi:mannose-1-phosphate guanylyltransferase
MFVWRAEVFAQKLEAFAPDLWRFWPPLVEALRKKNGRLLRRTFEKVPATSIDYALMEKAQGVYVGEGDFGWSDVGAWSSLFDVWKADKAGNVARGDRLVLDSQGCLIYNPGGLTALVGVRDLIIVQAGGALLVCPSSQDQRVKDVVELLRKMGKLRYL